MWLIGVDIIGFMIFGQFVLNRLMCGLGLSIYLCNVDYCVFDEVYWVVFFEVVWVCCFLVVIYYVSGGWSVGVVVLVVGWVVCNLLVDIMIVVVFFDGL